MENKEKTNDFSKNKDSIDLLKDQLQKAGIDTSEWGKGQAKTVEHLLKEIESGETFLLIGEDGKLLRKVIVGGADIYYTSKEGKTYRLKEEKQVFKDGRERKRDLGQAVSEKMKPEENPEEAISRGVQEELGINGYLNLKKINTDEKILISPSYPGLESQYIKHNFRVDLQDDQYNEDGYMEEQEDKNTYFKWEEVMI